MQQNAAAQSAPPTQNSTVYCAHCGTVNQQSEYSCVRCGERMFVPDPAQPPPTGLAACPKCEKPNYSRASYCVFCGNSMETAVRMSPAGATARTQTRGREHQRSEQQRAQSQPTAARTQTRNEPLRPVPVPVATGEANDSGTQTAHTPASLRGFNWGAFLLGPVWGLGNAVLPAIVIGLGALVVSGLTYRTTPWVGIGVSLAANLYIGYRANDWAWKARRWQSAEQFRRVQQGWLLWGVVLTVVMLIVYSFIMMPTQE